MSHNTHKLTALVTMSLAAVALAACDGVPASNQDVPSVELADALAVVALPDGRSFRFYEPAPGEIMVAARAPAGGDLSAMAMMDGEEPSALALYRALSEREPPPALVEAHARARTAIARAATDAAQGRIRVDDAAGNDTTVTTSALTSIEFGNRYCRSPDDWDYTACLLNTGTAFTTDRWGVSLGCRVQSQAGRAVLIHQTVYPFNSSSYTYSLVPQEIAYVYTYGFFTERKCVVLPLPEPPGTPARYDLAAWGDILF